MRRRCQLTYDDVRLAGASTGVGCEVSLDLESSLIEQVEVVLHRVTIVKALARAVDTWRKRWRMDEGDVDQDIFCSSFVRRVESGRIFLLFVALRCFYLSIRDEPQPQTFGYKLLNDSNIRTCPFSDRKLQPRVLIPRCVSVIALKQGHFWEPLCCSDSWATS